MGIRETLGRFVYDATPRSPLMGPPLPEGFDIWWPNFMLASRPGTITDLNLKFLNIKKDIANAIAKTELVPSEPYPHRVW